MRNTLTGICLLMGVLSLGMNAHSKKTFEPSITVECHGKMRTGVVAIGGETTGTTITFHKQSWELKLLNEESYEFAEDNNKEPVTAVGTLRRVKGTETKPRWIIDVKTLKKRDPKTTPDGALLTIQGTLRGSRSTPHQAAKLTIEAGELTWPIVFTTDPKLLTKAESLIDKTITLSGPLEPDTDSDPSTPAPVQAKTLTPVE